MCRFPVDIFLSSLGLSHWWSVRKTHSWGICIEHPSFGSCCDVAFSNSCGYIAVSSSYGQERDMPLDSVPVRVSESCDQRFLAVCRLLCYSWECLCLPCGSSSQCFRVLGVTWSCLRVFPVLFSFLLKWMFAFNIVLLEFLGPIVRLWAQAFWAFSPFSRILSGSCPLSSCHLPDLLPEKLITEDFCLPCPEHSV